MEDMLAGNNETDLFGSDQAATGGAGGDTADDIFGDSTEQQQQGSQDANAQPPSGNGSTDILAQPDGNQAADDIFGAPQGGAEDDIYAQGPTEPAEPERVSALVEWQEKKNQEIAVIDQQETEEIAKMRSKASEELAAFNKKIDEAQAKRAKHNQSVDEETKASLEENPENKWERVVKYIDFNRSELHEKDVSKMKSLLLQLKH